jgi:DNA-binding NarL/FixJ family response regulator
VLLHPETAPAVDAEGRRRERPPARDLIRVVLAEDHGLMRARLRQLLEEDELIEVIADTGELAEAVGSVFDVRPHVLVLDTSMARGSSIDAIRRLREQAPGTEIVVLKMEASAAFARHAFEAGALAYVLKDTADDELAQAVRHAARGDRFLSPRVAALSGRGIA